MNQIGNLQYKITIDHNSDLGVDITILQLKIVKETDNVFIVQRKYFDTTFLENKKYKIVLNDFIDKMQCMILRSETFVELFEKLENEITYSLKGCDLSKNEKSQLKEKYEKLLERKEEMKEFFK